MGVGWNVTPCGDIYNPPSRSNVSIFAIIEIVIMGVVAILSLIELVDYINGDKDCSGMIKTLVFVDDIAIVIAGVYVIIGLFFLGGSKTRIGILCFIFAGILSMVILVLQINEGVGDELLYSIFKFIIYLFLTFILWKQYSRI